MFVIQVYANGERRVRREFDDAAAARQEFDVMVRGWTQNAHAVLAALEWEAELFEEIDGDIVADLDAWSHDQHPDAPEQEDAA